MNLIRIVVAAVALSAAQVPSVLTAQDLQRGVRNYQDLMSGKKTFDRLTPQEKQEVIIIHGRISSRSSGGASAECRDATSQAESAASELADYARRLRNCAEARDFQDDCSTEFRRVRNAYSDYEDAVSTVASNCD